MEKQPTAEQVERFWQWCGWYRAEGKNTIERGMAWFSPFKELYSFHHLPDIDLNNLFKWAVPVIQGYVHIGIRPQFDGLWHIRVTTNREIDKYNRDPALALFWAVYEIIEGSK